MESSSYRAAKLIDKIAVSLSEHCSGHTEATFRYSTAVVRNSLQIVCVWLTTGSDVTLLRAVPPLCAAAFIVTSEVAGQ